MREGEGKGLWSGGIDGIWPNKSLSFGKGEGVTSVGVDRAMSASSVGSLEAVW